MKKINVNVDLNVFKRMMKEYLNGITFDDAYCYPSTDSEGKECYTTTVDILPLKTFNIIDKKDNYFYSRFLGEACSEEICDLSNKLSAEHFSINAAEGKLVFTSHVDPTAKKLEVKDLSVIMVNYLAAVDKSLESGDKICFHAVDTYYIDKDFEPVNPFFLNNLSYALNCESFIESNHGERFMEIAKKYGFEGYVLDLKLGTVRFYSSKLPQGWTSVKDADYSLPFGDDDYNDNINSLEGIDYPSQHSAVAQQVANQYQGQ